MTIEEKVSTIRQHLINIDFLNANLNASDKKIDEIMNSARMTSKKDKLMKNYMIMANSYQQQILDELEKIKGVL